MSTRYGGRDYFREFERDDDDDRYGRDYETGSTRSGRAYYGGSSRGLGSGRDADDFDTGRAYGGGNYGGGYNRGEGGGQGRERSRGYGSSGSGSGNYYGRGSDYDRYFGGSGGRHYDSDRGTDYDRGFGGYASGRGSYGRDEDDDRYNYGGGGYSSRERGRDYDRGGHDRASYGRGGYERGYTGREYDRGGRQGHDRHDEDDRGWWNRASDEVRSWFGDEEAERRRRSDEMSNQGSEDYFGGRHRGRGPKNYRRSDERIRDDVSDRLSDNDWLDASDIEVDVRDGEVTLSGTVESRYAKRLAEDLAESCSGVSNVQNNLRVKGRHSAGFGSEMSTTDSSTSTSADVTGTTGTTDATGTTGTTGGATGRAARTPS